MKRRIVIASLVGIGLLVFIFAPVLYVWTWTYPAGVDVTYYQSPSCLLFGFGTNYAFGHGLYLEGHPSANSVSYEFYCVEIPF